jgi:ABC-2 type transport system ATP-binding protein
MVSAMPAVEVTDLVVDHGTTRAVDGLSFQARAGEVSVLLGPNGAGKTSTVEAIAGQRRPTAGTVEVLGLDPVADHRALAASLGVMPQAGGVHSGIRPPEVLALYASFHADPADAEHLLERVGLADRRRSTWRQLSGGEQQRLSLALALVGRPLVAILDEPTAGVDVRGRHLIREIIRELAADGVCVLVTTHDLGEAEHLADRVVIVDHGHLVADGSPAELMRADGAEEILFGAPAGLAVADLGTELGAPVAEVRPGEYRVAAAASPATVAALTAWLARHDLPLADLRAGRQKLEDVFLRLTDDADGPTPVVSRTGRRQGPSPRGGSDERRRRR